MEFVRGGSASRESSASGFGPRPAFSGGQGRPGEAARSDRVPWGGGACLGVGLGEASCHFRREIKILFF